MLSAFLISLLGVFWVFLVKPYDFGQTVFFDFRDGRQ